MIQLRWRSGMLLPALLAGALHTQAQSFKDGKLTLNPDGSHYIKFTLLNQVWARYNQSNPGTQVNGFNKPETYDIGIRRFRMQFFGQLTDRVFIYSQIGINNYSYLSERKAGFFLHDAVGEYAVVKNKLSLGTGLGAWNGLSRFTASATGSIMGIDLPLVAETTNDVNDQFGRKLSIYAKGKLSKLDYRVALSDPLDITRGSAGTAALTRNANFSRRPGQPQYQAYLMWQFRDQESNLTAYNTGTYLGKKNVLNVGAGAIVQPKAMWYLADNGRDTLTQAMKQVAVDVYYDAPLDTAKGAPSVHFYAVGMHLDYGPGYLRTNGPMNPATGTRPNTPAYTNNALLGEFGNQFPQYGTGNVLYSQLGYKLRDNLVGSTTFMPYVSYQYSHYKRLADDLHYYDAGVNWLLAGHTSKLTLSYQNRPFYITNSRGENVVDRRRSAVVAQYQVSF
ncbi:hypothetical protein [Hymenobacter cellulosivorans]|uniref:Porin n=1 Tax=Hymenobacter cellulosivorans TaxID=2932249 RepID=A0ABY4F6L2_9BACT|nr:hypothetical protein [Hymenobacter cellulosivorans]UOQ51663.1 hypothetical protein MUN80_18090 [Hymenobacter cellulosivorans]